MDCAKPGSQRRPGTGSGLAIEVRPARPEDLSALTQIYNHYVLNTAVTFDVRPFTVEQRRVWSADFATRGRYRLMVAETSDGKLVGYAASRRFRPQHAFDTSVESSIYCAPGATGHGTGTRLYRALFDALAGEDIHRIVAAITLPNPASLALHEALGFRRIGTLTEAGRKFGRYWDVAWYERPLSL